MGICSTSERRFHVRVKRHRALSVDSARYWSCPTGALYVVAEPAVGVQGRTPCGEVLLVHLTTLSNQWGGLSVTLSTSGSCHSGSFPLLFSRSSSSVEIWRIRNFCTFPVTVIGNASTIFQYLGIL